MPHIHDTTALPNMPNCWVKPAIRKVMKDTVADLVIPIVLLIIFCMTGMVYSGGYFDATSDNYHHFVDAFAASNATYIYKEEVREALMLVDNNIQEIYNQRL